jgi:hypothetical protein
MDRTAPPPSVSRNRALPALFGATVFRSPKIFRSGQQSPTNIGHRGRRHLENQAGGLHGGVARLAPRQCLGRGGAIPTAGRGALGDAESQRQLPAGADRPFKHDHRVGPRRAAHALRCLWRGRGDQSSGRGLGLGRGDFAVSYSEET